MTPYTYTYDAAHNQVSKKDEKGTTTYTYDELNRLKTVTTPENIITDYTYDKSGNRETETITLYEAAGEVGVIIIQIGVK